MRSSSTTPTLQETEVAIIEPRTSPISLIQALIGLLVGAIVVSLAGAGLWFARVIPTVHPRPIDLSIKAMPAQVLGLDRYDLEVAKHPEMPNPNKIIAQEEVRDAAMERSYRLAYGGDGVDVGYGQVASTPLVVTAVNGDLNPPVATTSKFIEYLHAISHEQWLAVPGTPTTTCVFVSPESVPLPTGQTGDQLISDLLNSSEATVIVQCARRNIDRNLSVLIRADSATDPGKTPAQLAQDIAAETDRVWEFLD